MGSSVHLQLRILIAGVLGLGLGFVLRWQPVLVATSLVIGAAAFPSARDLLRRRADRSPTRANELVYVAASAISAVALLALASAGVEANDLASVGIAAVWVTAALWRIACAAGVVIAAVSAAAIVAVLGAVTLALFFPVPAALGAGAAALAATAWGVRAKRRAGDGG